MNTQTPNPFEPINARLTNLEALAIETLHLLRSKATHSVVEEEKPFNVGQAAEFLDISEQTVYQNIKKIPHKKRFGRLYFLKSELVDYLEAGTQKKA